MVSPLYQLVTLSDISLAIGPRDSLEAEEDVKEPTNQPDKQVSIQPCVAQAC